MSDKPIKIPDPDHPITIAQNPARVVVKLDGRVVADTRNALILREASYPPVQYIPREDVDMSLLERTDHASHCPYKGDASYYSIIIGGERAKNAVWTYEDPHAAVAEIRNRVAFYPDRVDTIEELRP
ncbi:DUF427 domain-containing protein [Ensifer adhaerens]|uniref:DUF427 domain-containing protein n=1 Tax=Ensifer adhaerens TaxID=106592 RepID=UPI003CFEFB77